MGEITVPMYVQSVSSATVTLKRPVNRNQKTMAGTNVVEIVVTTSEATALAGIWGTTASCNKFDVIFRQRR